MPSELTVATLDSSDRPTSILIVACAKASLETTERPFFAASLRNMIAYLTDHYDEETLKNALQVRTRLSQTASQRLEIVLF